MTEEDVQALRGVGARTGHGGEIQGTSRVTFLIGPDGRIQEQFGPR